MTKEQAKEQLKNFYGGLPLLTFSIKEYPNNEWVAQCNEIDSIITGGTGGDMLTIETLMQDAILTAAGIPRELVDGLLKRVWSGDIDVPVTTSDDVDKKLFQSTYKVNEGQHARSR